MTSYQGTYLGQGISVGIVVARFNEFITTSLLSGAVDALARMGSEPPVIVHVPGAFELPFAVQTLMEKDKKIDAVIALGAVIRGATPHFDYVCSQCASGLQSLQLSLKKPVIFGVLTTDTIEQAIERAGTKAGNKGADAAYAAIEMVTLSRSL